MYELCKRLASLTFCTTRCGCTAVARSSPSGRPSHNYGFAKAGVSCIYDSEVLKSSFMHLMKFSAENPRLRKAAKRCAKGSLRSPSAQRAAAAPQLHEVLPPVALRTTTVLQNSNKTFTSLDFFRKFAEPQRVSGHCKKISYKHSTSTDKK